MSNPDWLREDEGSSASFSLALRDRVTCESDQWEAATLWLGEVPLPASLSLSLSLCAGPSEELPCSLGSHVAEEQKRGPR